jgi:hypothetical protein
MDWRLCHSTGASPATHLRPTLHRYLAPSSRTWRAYNARCQRAQADVTGLADDVRDRPLTAVRLDSQADPN